MVDSCAILSPPTSRAPSRVRAKATIAARNTDSNTIIFHSAPFVLTGPASDVFPSSDAHNCRLVQSPVAETGCSTDHSESATIMLPSGSQSAAAEEACYDFAQYMAGQEDTDPYLSYRPTFGYSMPAQVFIQGITLTLLAVLLIHILFTTPYHWPLSRLNYILQVSGILLVTASVLLSTGLTLTAPDVTAKTWPYMLEYISVTIPPDDWSIAAQGAYQLLQGFCNMAVNVSSDRERWIA